MADTVEELASNPTQEPEKAQTATAETTELDNDPMVIAGREAQAEIDAAEKRKAQADPASNPEVASPTATADNTGGDKGPIMVPKPRLDEALAEKDRFKTALAHAQGVIDVQRQMLQEGKVANQNQQVDGQQQEVTPTKPDAKTLIAQAEDKKLELAQKFDDGEITLSDMKRQEVELDREIRSLTEQSLKAVSEEAKKVAEDTVSAAKAVEFIESEALKLAEKHPYIAEIDAQPPEIRTGIWQAIEKEAVASLARKGINANDGTLNSHIALMNEKAALTNTYGPKYTGKQLQPASQPEKKPLSEKGQQLAQKVEMANQQPPSLAGAGSGVDQKTDLTEDDINSMSQDQLADLMKRSPHLVNRAVGFT